MHPGRFSLSFPYCLPFQSFISVLCIDLLGTSACEDLPVMH